MMLGNSVYNMIKIGEKPHSLHCWWTTMWQDTQLTNNNYIYAHAQKPPYTFIILKIKKTIHVLHKIKQPTSEFPFSFTEYIKNMDQGECWTEIKLNQLRVF